MPCFNAIDLSKLPIPSVLEPLDYEAIVAEATAALTARAPELAPALALQSEPLVKLIQAHAYRELLLRNRVNEAARSGMLAFAKGADLDHKAADLGVTRLAGETDEELRARAVLAPEGFSVAGPKGAYVFHALSAHPDVADVYVVSPTPGVVSVYVLAASDTGNGVASAALVAPVSAALNADTVRPFTEQVNVYAAAVVPFQVTATLTFLPGPDSSVVLAAADAAVRAYAAERRRFGRTVTRAGLLAALMRQGVQNVALPSPAADLALTPTQASVLTAVTLTSGGVVS